MTDAERIALLDAAVSRANARILELEAALRDVLDDGSLSARLVAALVLAGERPHAREVMP